MGTYVRSFLGEPPAEELLVVRYPNQRRFFALAINRYYMLVAKPQRMKAARKFEASFTHSAGGQLVFQSNETSPIVIAKRFHPANTNPLVFKRTYLFRFDDQESCKAAMQPGPLNQLKETSGDASVQLYRRVPRKNALPAALGKLCR